MRSRLAIVGMAVLAWFTIAAGATGAAHSPTGAKFYVANFDRLPKAQMVLKVADDEIDRINFVVRMKCEGPNTRLSSGFLETKLAEDGSFSRKRDLGDFRGFMKISGVLERTGGSGSLHANLKGFKSDPDARSCRSGQTHWTASRVDFRTFDAVSRDIKNLPPRGHR